MIDLFPQTVDGETIVIPAGVFTGRILLTKRNCVFIGAGVGKTIIRAAIDHDVNEMVRSTIVEGHYTLKNLTIDCARNTNFQTALSADPGQDCTLENVHITGHVGSVALFNRHRMFLKNVTLTGDSGGIYHYTGAKVTYIDGLRQRGGKYTLLSTTDGLVTASDVTAEFNYWAIPTYETVSATGFGTTYVDVVSHVTAHRNLYDCVRALTPVGTFTPSDSLYCSGVKKWDRVETPSGCWAEVVSADRHGRFTLTTWHHPNSWAPCSTPTEEATVYRVALGRLYGTTPTRISFVTNGATGHWRTVDGKFAKTPTLGSLVHIIRHGYTGGIPRDVDSGAAHITDNAGPATLINWKVTGTFSDGITPRAPGCLLINCSVSYSQDMGFTLDGKHTLHNCSATYNGYNGFFLTNGPSELYNCTTGYNGTHNDGGGGWGLTADALSDECVLHVSCKNDLSGGIAGGTPLVYPYEG